MNDNICQLKTISEPSKMFVGKMPPHSETSIISILSPNAKENAYLKRRKENFLEKANQIHKNKYDYSKFIYINNRIKSIIICPLHGEFNQCAHEHLDKCGCSKCAIQRLPQYQSKTDAEFIKEARFIHENKYDYSKTEYHGAHIKVAIICKVHGRFYQTPHEHLSGRKCRKCGYETRHNNNGFKWKIYTFSNGRTEKIQGYENLTLDFLISTGSITINDIKIKQDEKPLVKYYWNGSERRYFPDCYLSSTNTIVETKSDYYWKSQYEQNLAKILGSLNSGYNIQFVIWNRQHHLVSKHIWKSPWQ
jgi:hypothetical protein